MGFDLIFKHFYLRERVGFLLDELIVMFDICETLVEGKEFILVIVVSCSLN